MSDLVFEAAWDMGSVRTSLSVWADRYGVDLEAELFGVDRDVVESCLSWAEWDALVAAVEENRPVPYEVVP